MQIAILVWGSLYWDPRNLETTGDWFNDGPLLPIEFARISGGNRLTLVIKPGYDDVATLYAISAFDNLLEARENLRSRENTPNIENIGFIDFATNTQYVRQLNLFIIERLIQWNRDKNFGAIIWSDFSPRFSDVTNTNFTIENVILFLSQLADNEKLEALKYIRKAPAQISTRYRDPIQQHFSNIIIPN